MIDEQSSASGHDYASDRSAIGADSSGRMVTHSAGTGARSAVELCFVLGRPGAVPFVSDRPGAYGRLLLAVYVRWKSGVLVPSDWLRSVRRAVGEPASRSVCTIWMTSAD